MMKYDLVGSCPNCGAGVFVIKGKVAPIFTCPCHEYVFKKVRVLNEMYSEELNKERDVSSTEFWKEVRHEDREAGEEILQGDTGDDGHGGGRGSHFSGSTPVGPRKKAV